MPAALAPCGSYTCPAGSGGSLPASDIPAQRGGEGRKVIDRAPELIYRDCLQLQLSVSTHLSRRRETTTQR